MQCNAMHSATHSIYFISPWWFHVVSSRGPAARPTHLVLSSYPSGHYHRLRVSYFFPAPSSSTHECTNRAAKQAKPPVQGPHSQSWSSASRLLRASQLASWLAAVGSRRLSRVESRLPRAYRAPSICKQACESELDRLIPLQASKPKCMYVVRSNLRCPAL